MMTQRWDANGNPITKKQPTTAQYLEMGDPFEGMANALDEKGIIKRGFSDAEYDGPADYSKSLTGGRSRAGDGNGRLRGLRGGLKMSDLSKHATKVKGLFKKMMTHKDDILKLAEYLSNFPEFLSHIKDLPRIDDLRKAKEPGSSGMAGGGFGADYSSGDPRSYQSETGTEFSDVGLKAGSRRTKGGDFFGDIWDGIKSAASWIWDNKDTILPIVKGVIQLAAGKDHHEINRVLDDHIIGGVHNYILSLPALGNLPEAEFNKWMQKLSDDLEEIHGKMDDDSITGQDIDNHEYIKKAKKYATKRSIQKASPKRDKERQAWLEEFSKKLEGRKDGPGKHKLYEGERRGRKLGEIKARGKPDSDEDLSESDASESDENDRYKAGAVSYGLDRPVATKKLLKPKAAPEYIKQKNTTSRGAKGLLLNEALANNKYMSPIGPSYTPAFGSGGRRHRF